MTSQQPYLARLTTAKCNGYMNRVENISEAAICICDTAIGKVHLHAQLYRHGAEAPAFTGRTAAETVSVVSTTKSRLQMNSIRTDHRHKHTFKQHRNSISKPRVENMRNTQHNAIDLQTTPQKPKASSAIMPRSSRYPHRSSSKINASVSLKRCTKRKQPQHPLA
jgi:hypothetical protein